MIGLSPIWQSATRARCFNCGSVYAMSSGAALRDQIRYWHAPLCQTCRVAWWRAGGHLIRLKAEAERWIAAPASTDWPKRSSSSRHREFAAYQRTTAQPVRPI